MNLSAGLRGARVPRPMKPYRTMLPRMKNKVHEDTSLREKESHEVSNVEDVHVGCKHGHVAAAAMSKHITVVSAGARWNAETSRYLERPSKARARTMAAALVGRNMDNCGILVVDCLKYSDPEAHESKNSWLKQHIGQHPVLLEQTWNGNPGYRDSIFYAVKRARQAAISEICIIFICKPSTVDVSSVQELQMLCAIYGIGATIPS